MERWRPRKVVIIADDTPLSTACDLMARRNIRHLVVADLDRKPIGIVSERDIFRFLAQRLATNKTISGTVSIRQLMTKSPVTVRPTAPISEAVTVAAMPLLRRSRREMLLISF